MSNPSFQLRICSARVVHDEPGPGFVQYEISWLGWRCKRRFSEFVALRRSLSGRSQELAGVPFPSKTLVRSFAPDHVQARRAALQHWLQCVVKSDELCKCAEVRQFLAVPPHDPSHAQGGVQPPLDSDVSQHDNHTHSASSHATARSSQPSDEHEHEHDGDDDDDDVRSNSHHLALDSDDDNGEVEGGEGKEEKGEEAEKGEKQQGGGAGATVWALPRIRGVRSVGVVGGPCRVASPPVSRAKPRCFSQPLIAPSLGPESSVVVGVPQHNEQHAKPNRPREPSPSPSPSPSAAGVDFCVPPLASPPPLDAVVVVGSAGAVCGGVHTPTEAALSAFEAPALEGPAFMTRGSLRRLVRAGKLRRHSESSLGSGSTHAKPVPRSRLLVPR